MSDTKIEWTDATWNPVRGCSRVSEGCRNCYAEHQALRITRFDRAKNTPEGEGAYDGLVHLTSQGPKWTGQIRELMEKLGDPIRWKKPKRVFVNSMSDLFHEGVSDVFIADVFAAMAYARQHTFQVLTKRPERMLQLLTSEDFAELYDQATGIAHEDACEVLGRRGEFNPNARLTTDIRAMDPALPRPNIWLGVSVEDQPTADERIPLLLQTPAAVRFISAEPLLGPVGLSRWIEPTLRCGTCAAQYGPDEAVPDPGHRFGADKCARCGAENCMFTEWGYEAAQLGRPDQPDEWDHGYKLHQVIAGGESGRGSRLMKAEWARSLRDQCEAAGVPFFFKQWGGTDKKEAGRLLDGREWNEFPEVAHGHD